MSLRLGTTQISGIATNTKSNSNTLLSFKWSDHIINSMEWLRADTFSWQAGSVYTFAYQHLTADISTATQSTETIAGTTITVYTATDGHKIVLADQESAVSAIYSATGVAWYYIVDTANTQFKLPRTQYGFNGLRDGVGKYIPESLPNITGTYTNVQGKAGDSTGVFIGSTHNTGSNEGGMATTGNNTLSFNASNSSSSYQDNAPVQQRATQMHLYFYVGEFSQSATEQTAGITTEVLNNKADRTDVWTPSTSTYSQKQTIIDWAASNQAHLTQVETIASLPYTVSQDGFFQINIGAVYSTWVKINDIVVHQTSRTGSDGDIWQLKLFRVKAGDVITAGTNNGGYNSMVLYTS